MIAFRPRKKDISYVPQRFGSGSLRMLKPQFNNLDHPHSFFFPLSFVRSLAHRPTPSRSERSPEVKRSTDSKSRAIQVDQPESTLC